MSDASPDEQDSRIVSLGAQRTRRTTSTNDSSTYSSRHTSREPPSKRQRRNQKAQGDDVRDFVPQGANFSANSLGVDPDTSPASDSEDSTSSSESESYSDSDSDSDNDNSRAKENKTESNVGSAPTPNWNKTGRGVIRTSLRSQQPSSTNANASVRSESTSAAEKRTESVNGEHLRSSRSASADSKPSRVEDTGEEGKGDPDTKSGRNTDVLTPEEGEVNEGEEGSGPFKPVPSDESDDSESMDSEADDSIMLNTISSRGQKLDQNGAISISDDDDDDDPASTSLMTAPGSGAQDRNLNDAISIFDDDSGDDYDPESLPVDGDDYDPESLPVSQASINNHIPNSQNGSGDGAKEAALLCFAQKYPTAPSTLADLDHADLEIQAKIVFYDRDINDINLQLPITCTECMQEGHLAEVCPTKECIHCGAWNKHQSALCPQWRRCQRCRERGHDQKHCPSALKGSATEIPCDLCGSSEHVELGCDSLWKFPRRDTTAAPALVSISCANCTSNRHLIGDCPTLTRPLASSAFTIRGIDPSMITNINSVVSVNRGSGPSAPLGGRGGMKIRGRADQATSPSPDSDDMMSRGGKKGTIGGNRNMNRGNIKIRIGNNAGKNRNPGPPLPPSARDYRDREDLYPRNHNSRQHSMSPARDRRPGRGRGGWQPGPPRSPPSGQGRPPPRPGRGGGGGRGNGRGADRGGAQRGGSGDAYRPMPSAAKKAWDKYRL
ncbi:zinc knuckle domain protein [Aspergillus lucknowensis]|uniref:CCHC-type domain-containing protein n=1 Tax=Aspergillus lucknowensis TaxID=176173 RepID=A0ABR4LHE0_9EURO